MDIFLTIVFSIEAFLKIVAFGFLFCGPQSYIRNYWNIIDFVIVIFSIISLAWSQVNLNIVKVLRLLRVLRPLRVISRNEGLKISIQSLLIAIPKIVNVIVISLLFFLIFGIIGVNYLKGIYFYCEPIEEFEMAG